MTREEVKNFEVFLWKSFKKGEPNRELRLSDEEIELVRQKYPNAVLKPMQSEIYADGKQWYEVTI